MNSATVTIIEHTDGTFSMKEGKPDEGTIVQDVKEWRLRFLGPHTKPKVDAVLRNGQQTEVAQVMMKTLFNYHNVF